MIKRIDRLLVKAFLPPFLLSFFIALFVLIMQTLWTWVDKIMGKGVGIFVLLEMIGYLCLALFPLALPIGILIASVMVFGNLSERYELVAMKSAGVSLLRIMLPTVILTIGVSILSLTCSNYLIPVANLKSKTRLLDIKRQKPALSIQEGSFNEDFAGFTMYIGDKSKDDGGLKDVLIYDHTTDKTGRLVMVQADRGRMSTEAQGRALKLSLEDGYQYMEHANSKGRTHPFVKMKFDRHERVFDLSQFDLERTDENRHKEHYSMLSMGQLTTAIDTIRHRLAQNLAAQADYIFTGEFKNKLNHVQPGKPQMFMPDSSRLADMAIPFLETFSSDDRRRLTTKTVQSLNRLATRISREEIKEINHIKSLARHRYEYHIKLASAAVCLIFLFIGAPMGAIIRKGGYGYPLIVTILFFMLYMVLTISLKETMKVGGIDAMLAAWVPIWVLMPIGAVLTYMALTNRKILVLDGVRRWIKQLWIKK